MESETNEEPLVASGMPLLNGKCALLRTTLPILSNERTKRFPDNVFRMPARCRHSAPTTPCGGVLTVPGKIIHVRTLGQPGRGRLSPQDTGPGPPAPPQPRARPRRLPPPVAVLLSRGSGRFRWRPHRRCHRRCRLPLNDCLAPLSLSDCIQPNVAAQRARQSMPHGPAFMVIRGR